MIEYNIIHTCVIKTVRGKTRSYTNNFPPSLQIFRTADSVQSLCVFSSVIFYGRLDLNRRAANGRHYRRERADNEKAAPTSGSKTTRARLEERGGYRASAFFMGGLINHPVLS